MRVPSRSPDADMLHFRLSSRHYLDLTIGHKPNSEWHLLFARTQYRNSFELAHREIVRLDLSSRKSRAQRLAKSRYPTFWFNNDARTSWESHGKSLLDLLLNLDTPRSLFELTPSKRPIRRADQLHQVDVIIAEEALARWCEDCKRWESLEELDLQPRWIAVDKDADGSPTYLCPKCFSRDWSGARFKRWTLRTLRRRFR